ncbi:MAG TPA: bifunctional phosphopantothenoylcysteine decarboxylase/phosphopantothenate--cysteine ligase CoaBC [Methanotrichaceae archaeon]|nr:bifunctional phosphopantothenoylcysteine decarboxylase/phosphopantothenate--cysteine ligase CoaBC [Methanotrichaceae archaeon]HQF16453.1 bifunctional phosphopantothenoylcysteine decarboxylase/phosphopantothenate--cysteine ligase CoaBC [Methanotrichaceae archaeon]HQI91876.1 bifunctional phosphopantothenoylcysteine decarboxylase/phosphopantothenate--cysteine ligase CoaBC [Methanotrichaceae archaeon]HQJ28433.1 bifunctional phosphopantothenoylcysteine decarboxylase/phosphopantothenate--cysteine l
MELSISGTVSDYLRGKTIVVAVTGSIAAVRTVDLVRDLIRRGARVHCVMSRAACQILHPSALEYASGQPVITEITGRVEHVELCGMEGPADLLLVAPATANTIGKMACGIDDTAVTTFATTAIGSKKKVMVVPAMHEAMYCHPAVVENLRRLEQMGVVVVGPRLEESKAKIAENSHIVLDVERLLGPGDLRGIGVLITSGSTAERIDPIRILTNRASGRTGVELAFQAYRMGADVALVHRFHLDLPFQQIYAESASDMLEAVVKELSCGRYQAMIAAAAVGDYTLDPEEQKIKSGDELVLHLRPTVKIVRAVREAHPLLRMITFKAETFVSDQELVSSARESMQRSGSDIVVANDVGSGGMGTEENRVLIIGKDGRVMEARGHKSLIARAIIDALVEAVRG